jgi:hypothetical protein
MAGISPNFFPPPDSSGEMPAEEAMVSRYFIEILKFCTTCFVWSDLRKILKFCKTCPYKSKFIVFTKENINRSLPEGLE